MGEHEDCHPVRFQETVEGVQSTVQIKGIHQHIVRDHQVKGRISKGAQFGTGIHAEVDSGIMSTSDLDHALGEVNTRDTSTPVTELFGQIPGATTCVEYREPVDITCELPQNRIGIQNAVAISLISNLYLPINSHTVPQISGCFQLAITHRSVSYRTRRWYSHPTANFRVASLRATLHKT